MIIIFNYLENTEIMLYKDERIVCAHFSNKYTTIGMIQKRKMNEFSKKNHIQGL